MDPLTSKQVSDLLERAGPGSVVHLVGAGGCGVSALGHLLLDLGHHVSGSDLAENADVRQLRQRGAAIHVGHSAQHITEARPVLVVYSPAVRFANPELQQAAQLQIPAVRRAVLLAALFHRQQGLAVAGMHGKTTTSALLAYALETLGARPSYYIGAQVPQLPRAARFAQGNGGGPPARSAGPDRGEPEKHLPYFAIEADESDGTLREFHPQAAIVLNVDEEHLDYFPNLDAVCAEFRQFASQTRGPLVFCADDPRLPDLFADRPKAISFGFQSNAIYRIESAAARHTSCASRFVLRHKGEILGEFSTQLVGEKNISNVAAVIALLHQLGFAAEKIAPAIAGFTGAARRQQELFHDTRFRLFDDYGHHPAEIEATLRALKPLASRRLLVAFQPHRFTRTQRLLRQFAGSFRAADHVWITPIYAASEAEIPGVSGPRLVEAIREQGQVAEYAPTLDALRRAVRAAMVPGDLVLFLGAGDITGTAHALADELKL